MLKKIFDYVMSNGEVSQKKNILTVFSGKNDNIYTKKVVLSGKGLKIDGCFVRCISISSSSPSFNDVTEKDLRINFTNIFKKWVNVQAHSLSDETLKNIADALNIK